MAQPYRIHRGRVQELPRTPHKESQRVERMAIRFKGSNAEMHRTGNGGGISPRHHPSGMFRYTHFERGSKVMKNTRLYACYGSNMSIDQMSRRCPTAKIVGTAALDGHRLAFRGHNGNCHATVEQADGQAVPLLIWAITPRDEASLDVYEGFPNYYRKETVTVRLGNRNRRVMLYVMNGQRLGAPSGYYYNVILSGYKSFGFDTRVLETALRESCGV